MKAEEGARFEDLTDEELKRLLERAHQGDTHAREEIVQMNLRLVWSVVQRFLNRGYEPEDLFQVGCIGLIKAVDKFDLSYDVRFSTYAVPMIIGEIQRFLRDDHAIKVSRSLKEIGAHARRKREQLLKELGRQPTIHEIAEALQLQPEEIILAQEALRQPASLYETVYENDRDPILLEDQIQDENDNGEQWVDHLALKEVLSRLDERDRKIVFMRYMQGKTQSEVAAVLGVSQVQVSRLEKRILNRIRVELQE
ncbi:MAG: RNA polymerase sporulation sigma factor SigF [Firmicutes bacterium]|nr:RNA polymerase sporulation sigma factor SigF [Bacillota bacterium]